MNETRANVCQHHYETVASEDAAAWCKARGINGTAEARAFLRWKLPALGKSEPGLGWARRILERAAVENMPFISLEFARQALVRVRSEEPAAREPGEDESEKGAP